MAKGENITTGLSRGVAEVVGTSVTKNFQKFISDTFEANKGTLDRLAKDLLSGKGILDDSAGSIIFTKFREMRKEGKYQALMRLLDCLNKPQRDDFVIVSIGHLTLTSQTKRDDLASLETQTAGVKSNLQLLGIDFNDPKQFELLFKTYDYLVADFEKIEQGSSEATDFCQQVVELVKRSNLYGNETLRKRWYGLMVSVRDWEEIPGQLVKALKKLDESLKEPMQRIENAALGLRAKTRRLRRNTFN